MSLSPIYAGDTPLVHNSFTYDDDSVFPLTGLVTSNFTMEFVSSGGTVTTGTGTWSNINASAGTADYQMSSGDTATAETVLMRPRVQLANGPRTFDEQTLEIKE